MGGDKSRFTMNLWIWKSQKGSQRLVFVSAQSSGHFGEEKSCMRILILLYDYASSKTLAT